MLNVFKMRTKQYLQEQLTIAAESLGLYWPERAVIEIPKDPKFGDLACNIAMLLAKDAKRRPTELARDLAEKVLAGSNMIIKAEPAGPGFLNITFNPSFLLESVPAILDAGDSYGTGGDANAPKAHIEYVSANPTGPLHIGHARGAALGDSLIRLLRFTGHEVHSEYYINDAGRQMRALGESVLIRAQELRGKDVEFPEDGYQGEYIIDIARQMLAQNPDLPALPRPEALRSCTEYAANAILEGIKADLAAFRVEHEAWFYESQLLASGAVDRAFSMLGGLGLIFEEDGAVWLRTESFGDDKNRVLRKSDGSLTYFTTDIAYHLDKYERGYDLIVDLLGADHHGYVPRLRASLEALGKRPDSFAALIIQMVSLSRDGEQIAMSTRAGEFVTLTEVLQEVGTDAARFIFLSRKSDSPLDFDLELVKKQSLENPVYYVQYAHARICALGRKAKDAGFCLPKRLTTDDLLPLNTQEDIELLKHLDAFPENLRNAAANLAPHHVSHYLLALAGMVHRYYTMHQVIGAAEPGLALARLALLNAAGQVLRNGLAILGVSAPESM